MRPIALAAAAAALALAGCDEHTWDRPGTSRSVQQDDHRECRQQARSEEFRSYALHSGFAIMGPGYWGFRAQPDPAAWRQRLEREPVFYQNRLTSFCMRNKGYTLVKLDEGYRAVPRPREKAPAPGLPPGPPVNLPPAPPGNVKP